MEWFITRTLDVFLLLCFLQDVSLISKVDAIPSFCTAASRGHITQEIVPDEVKVSTHLEPPVDSGDLNLELCPDNTTLKISWRMIGRGDLKEFNTRLCFKVKSLHNGELLQKLCVTFGVRSPNGPLAVTCRFQMLHFTRRPIISAMVTAQGLEQVYTYYGQINTSSLDPLNTCRSKDVCEVTMMRAASSVISCYDRYYVTYDVTVTVMDVWFESIESSTCKNGRVTIYRKSASQLLYSVNCSYHGLGHLKIYYKINDRFCLKYHLVRVICDSATTSASSALSTTATPGVDDFKTFVIFGVVCMTVITCFVVGLIFVIQRAQIFHRGRRQCKAPPRTKVKFHDVECFPLNNANQEVPEPVHVDSESCVRDIIEQTYRKAADTISRQDSQTTTTSSIIRGQSTRRLHRSMTAALLEDTGAPYRQKILFLPTPFDQFSRDATDLLKTLFTMRLNVPTQCCYDRDVSQKYFDKTARKYDWIETLLADYNRILVFLCFTSIGGETKRRVVDDILDNILLTSVRPNCNIAFLHVVDTSENLEKNHHGDSFHLRDENSFRDFLCGVLTYCGRSSTEEEEVLDTLMSCETSKHFLKMIGIKTD